MDKAEVIERISLVAHHQPTEVAQPGEEPLDLPAAPVTPQGPPILRLGPGAIAPVGGDHLDAQRRERGIQRIGIVGAVANEPLGQFGYETGIEGGGDEGNLVRRSRGGTSGERKTSAVPESPWP